MSRWKRLSSDRLIAMTLVLFATSIGSFGCEIIAKVDRSTIDENAGGRGGEGGAMSSSTGMSCASIDDMNECTIDECVNGTPTHTAVKEGTPCNNGELLCNVMGVCVACLTADDCPGEDNACQTRTCSALGSCGFDYVPANTPIVTQTVGDCKITVCDGNGMAVMTDDDLDRPDDSNACTEDVCTAGVPTNPPKMQGTQCGVNGNGDPLVCNDMGQCFGCNTAMDCPGIDDECKQRTCDSDGFCGVTFTPADAPVMDQTANDCLLHVCDGNGQMTDIVDDMDLPVDDDNVCTTEACSMGVPSTDDVPNGTACNDGDLCTSLDTCQMGICIAGISIACMAQDQCHIAGTCDPMTGLCSNPNAADGTSCSDGNACTQTDVCSAGSCTGANPILCAASDQCHLAGTCDPMTGMCSSPAAMDGTSCNDENACTQTDVCQAGTCTGANPVTCAALDQCHLAGTCDTMTGMCSNPLAANGTPCISNAAAGMCVMGTCIACGDGLKSATEACDDGNTTTGDGCTANCVVELGYTCTGAPSACTPICGDGLFRGNEQCDDANTTSGDGCSNTCQLDITCGAGEVSVLVTNTISGAIPDTHTGLLSSITISQTGVVRKAIPTIYVTHANASHLDVFLAPPFGVQRNLVTDVSSTSGNFSATTFSDAAPVLITTGTAPFVGTYRPEETISNAAGFANQSANGVWTLHLADDTVGTTGTLNGWALALCIDPAVASVCGNGIVEANEQCDDGNTKAGDGCTTCQLEFTCGANQTLVVQRSTGPAQVIADNDPTGVTSSIHIANNGTVAKAIAVINGISHQYDGDLAISLISPMGTNLDLSSFNGSSNDNFVSTIFDDTAPGSITGGVAPYRGRFRPEAALSGVIGEVVNGNWTMKVVDGTHFDAGTFTGWSVGLCIAPLPTCGDGTLEIGETCDDANTTAGDGCSAICTVEPGYTCTGMSGSVCAFTCGNGNVSGNEQCDDNNTTSGDTCSGTCQWEFTPESEPNGACGGTNGPFNVPFIYDGAITPVGDLDFVAFTVPAHADVKLETFSPTMGVCTADTIIELRRTDCTSILASDDDDGISNCSLIDPSSVADAAAKNLDPGIYYVRVERYNNDQTIASYKLQVTFSALCGDGITSGSETCDDGNTASGDGCANDCRTETGFTCTGQGPGSCSAICGDGLIRGSETCDDMKLTNGDGCSDVCLVESGYTCVGEPSVCTP